MDKIDEWFSRLSGETTSNKASQPSTPQKKGVQQSTHQKGAPHGAPQQRGASQNQDAASNKGQQHVPHGGQKPPDHRGGQQHGSPQKGASQHSTPHYGTHKGSHRHAPPRKRAQEYSPQPKKAPMPILKGKLKIIPLGGLNEVGKNMMLIEYENDIIVIDMGLEFPNEDMMGIDYVIPDVSYLEENKHRIRGIVITHGHLDHIGGIPYILPKLDFPPVYGTRLTMGLIQKRCDEFKQQKLAKLNIINPVQPLRLGCFLIGFFRVNHSIPDAVGLAIDTPVGKIVHTGDFKFDATPARNQEPADLEKMERLGHQNVLAMFCESTNALKPGHSISETEVGKTLDGIVRDCKGRVIIASFSSQIGRIQLIIDSAISNNRKVFISGRSMRDNIDIAMKLGYIQAKKGYIQDIRQYKKTPDNEVLILTTGSQGEAVSALARISDNEHPHCKIKKGDTIVLSSSPIIGNEKAIHTVINKLSMLGADVIHNDLMDVHTSGHGKQDELARMIRYIKPRYLVPVHGEYYMRIGLGKLAMQKCGIVEDRIVMVHNGDILVGERDKIYKAKETVETKYILIDGTGHGHIGSQVQIDREIMSQNGTLVVLIYISKKNRRPFKDPDVISRGFIYMHETEEITQEVIKLARDAYKRIMDKNPGADRRDIKKYICQTIDRFTHDRLERRPLIVPLIIEV